MKTLLRRRHRTESVHPRALTVLARTFDIDRWRQKVRPETTRDPRAAALRFVLAWLLASLCDQLASSAPSQRPGSRAVEIHRARASRPRNADLNARSLPRRRASTSSLCGLLIDCCQCEQPDDRFAICGTRWRCCPSGCRGLRSKRRLRPRWPISPGQQRVWRALTLPVNSTVSSVAASARQVARVCPSACGQPALEAARPQGVRVNQLASS